MAILFLFLLFIGNVSGAVSKKKVVVSNNSFPIKISKQEAKEIGEKIWKNECGNDYQKLTWWNEGEEFASLGAIHAIWYPKGVKLPFKETFPELLNFIKAKGKKLPNSLIHAKDTLCPWHSRDEFMAAMNTKAMKELRHFLFETIDFQIEFIIRRLEKTLPRLLRSLSNQSKRIHVKQQFYRVARSKNGMYALIDYLNFKGDGSEPSSYEGCRWGLLQVLEGMQGGSLGKTALEDFARSAKQVLEQRVQHAPQERNEARWLPGWHNRINTYTKYN